MARKKKVTETVAANAASVPSTAAGITALLVAGLSIYANPTEAAKPENVALLGTLIAGGLAGIFATGKKKPVEPEPPKAAE